jgi:hypothetical protein
VGGRLLVLGEVSLLGEAAGSLVISQTGFRGCRLLEGFHELALRSFSLLLVCFSLQLRRCSYMVSIFLEHPWLCNDIGGQGVLVFG